MTSRWFQALLALLPLLLTPVVVFVLAEGWVNLGGGEKDVLFALPWLIWSLVFFLAALVLILHRWSPRRWLVRSAVVATVILLLLAVVAFLGSWLGIA